jgi:6-phosphofructokinase 1
MADNDLNFEIARLGECRIPSPMAGVRFVRDDEHVLYHTSIQERKPQ